MSLPPDPLSEEARRALDGIRDRAKQWRAPAEQKPLIVLDPGHGNFVVDYLHERDEVETQTTERVRRKGKWHSQTITHNGLNRYKGATMMWPNGDGTYTPKERYDGRSSFPAGTWVYDPGAQMKVRHYAGETLVRADGTEYTYDGREDIARGTWVRSQADHIDKHTVSRLVTVSEDDINLTAAQKLATLLRERGFEVILTRNGTDDILASRYDARIETGLDRKVMHISMHCDDNSNRSFAGMKGYYHYLLPNTSHSAAFSRALADDRTSKAWQRSAMLNPDVMGTTIPAATLEMGNLRNPADLKRLTQELGQMETVAIVAERVQVYYNANKPMLQALHTVAEMKAAPKPAVSDSTGRDASEPLTIPKKSSGQQL